jgi:hypothetical protein
MPLDSIEVDSRFRLNALLGQLRWSKVFSIRVFRDVYTLACFGICVALAARCRLKYRNETSSRVVWRKDDFILLAEA